VSKPTTKAIVAAHGRIDVDAISDLFASEPSLELVGIIDNDLEWGRRNGYDADVLLVACGGPSDEVLDLIEQEASGRAGLPVIVVFNGVSANGFVRQVFDAGADDIVLAEDLGSSGPEVRFAVQKALTRRATPHLDETGQGDLICVLGPKGGTGKTLTSSNLACALALEGKRVALVDLDLQFGDLGLVMGITPDRSIFDLATAGGSLDIEKIDAFLSRHSSGARVLLAPTRPDHASAITPEFLRELYPLLRTQFDYVVVDTPPGFTPEVITTIDSATAVCLIGTLDAPSLKNAKLGAETLELMGYPRERVRVVLNRADTSVGVTHADVVNILGRAPDVLVPSNREVVRSVNAGEPVVQSVPRSEAAKAFRALAQMFIASSTPAVAPERSRRSRGFRALTQKG
jgi:pilus assembly protein CpaE